jgi:hypothetical protein
LPFLDFLIATQKFQFLYSPIYPFFSSCYLFSVSLSKKLSFLQICNPRSHLTLRLL